MKKKYIENFNEQENILKYHFTILIKKEGLKANEIKSDLIKNRFLYEPFDKLSFSENLIYDFINNTFKRHFSFLGNSKAYLSNYKEREGSLEISFIIIIICGYGGIRETMDYFYEDLDFFFNSDSQFDVSINYEDKSSKLSQKKSKDNNSFILSLEKQIRTLKILVFILMFFILVFGMYMLTLNDKIIDNDDIENIIDKKLEHNNLKSKIDYLYINEVLKNNQPHR